MSDIDLSVIISTLANYRGLERVLDGYDDQVGEGGKFEVIVALDRGDPEPARVEALLANRPYPARLVRGAIRGLSANRNAGWKVAAAPLVLFTDNDTIPSPRLVTEHLEWHRRWPEPEVAVLGHVRWAREVRVSAFMHWLDHGIQFDYPAIEGIEAGWGRFYGANVSVKRDLLVRLDGFDEERLPYLYEDLDFAYRASRLGLQVLYNRAAEIEHLREVDFEFWRRRSRRLAEVERVFVRLHPELRPYFHDLFSDAAGRAPARGRGRALIKRIPRSMPLLGPYVWRSADLYYRQAIAPAFLEAWGERAAAGEGAAPYELEPATDWPGS